MNTLDSMIKSAKTTARNVALATAMVYNAACGGGGTGPSPTPTGTPTPSATVLRLEKVDTFSGRSFGTTDYTLTNGCADVTVDTAGMSKNWFAARGSPSALVGPLYGKATGTSSARVCPTGTGIVTGVLYMYDNSVLSDGEIDSAYNGNSSLGSDSGGLGKNAWNRNVVVYPMNTQNAPNNVTIVFQSGNLSQMQQGIIDLNNSYQIPGREKVGNINWSDSNGNMKAAFGYVSTSTSNCFQTMGCHANDGSWFIVRGDQSSVAQRGNSSSEASEAQGRFQNPALLSVTHGNPDGSITKKGAALYLTGGTLAPDQ